MDEQSNVNIGSASNGSSAGLVIGIIVIIVIIILGGLYFWKQNNVSKIEDNNIDSVNTQSQADDTSSIEADLNSTDVDYVDAELNAS